jgi:hypothetical protein
VVELEGYYADNKLLTFFRNFSLRIELCIAASSRYLKPGSAFAAKCDPTGVLTSALETYKRGIALMVKLHGPDHSEVQEYMDELRKVLGGCV